MKLFGVSAADLFRDRRRVELDRKRAQLKTNKLRAYFSWYRIESNNYMSSDFQINFMLGYSLPILVGSVPLGGPLVYGLRRWNREWPLICIEMAQDHRAWSASVNALEAGQL